MSVRRSDVKVWTPGRLFAKTYKNAGFTEHEDGDLSVTRGPRIIAIYPKGQWRRVMHREAS